ncbi:MAG: hypothetical protein LM522_13105, partial [Candidatus Contendobacter sp.]|nr:hypothetical protein [Candidatus Contendobacter sp.]
FLHFLTTAVRWVTAPDRSLKLSVIHPCPGASTFLAIPIGFYECAGEFLVISSWTIPRTLRREPAITSPRDV